MWSAVLGPSFTMTLNSTSDEAQETLATWIREGRCPFHVVRAGSHFTLSTPDTRRHFWSPALNLEVREEDGQPLINGRFNPSPAIWTGYMLTYLSLVTISLGSAMWGTAQVILGRTPWAFLFIPVCLVLAGTMFWFSFVGQRLARPEMKAMRAGLCDILDVADPGRECY